MDYMATRNRKIYCVVGIDTDIGKTVATGLIARSCKVHGINAITMKAVQTGCQGISEDIVRHRQLMSVQLLDIDLEGKTCPYLFAVPCSPHLAARLENRCIDCAEIRSQATRLAADFEVVLLEAAGGLFVPLNDETMFIDFVEQEKYPVILVTSNRLGSINHTLSALELLSSRNIEVAGVVYNIGGGVDQRITEDSREVITNYLHRQQHRCTLIDLEPLENYKDDRFPDFSSFFVEL
jgi:dethiobiotin synthetase